MDEAKRELKAAQAQASYEALSEKQILKEMKRLEKAMHDSARNLEFEQAATYRDQLKKLKVRFYGAEIPDDLASGAA